MPLLAHTTAVVGGDSAGDPQRRNAHENRAGAGGAGRGTGGRGKDMGEYRFKGKARGHLSTDQ